MDKYLEAKEENKKNRSLSIRGVSIFFIVITTVMLFFLVITMSSIYSQFDELVSTTNDYIELQSKASDFMVYSDYLTNEVRSFVSTKEKNHFDLYYSEYKVQKNRDKALKYLKDHSEDKEAIGHLQNAMDKSNELIDVEFYAMRLVVDAMHYHYPDYPDEISDVIISAEHNSLSDEEKLSVATGMVFGSEYEEYKNAIKDSVNNTITKLISNTQRVQFTQTESLRNVIRTQLFLIIILYGILLVIIIIVIRLLVNPLSKSSKYVLNRDYIPSEGAKELKYLIDSYNTILKDVENERNKLEYEASHDSLTGIWNRGELTKLLQLHHDETLALVMIDVDHFKGINDRFGHDTGDKVLKKLAVLLLKSFRTGDSICRMGGDEFAVIMYSISEENKDRVNAKIEYISEKLADTSDELPYTSISAGVAFGEPGFDGTELMKKADKALYKVKYSGRNGINFYDPDFDYRSFLQEHASEGDEDINEIKEALGD